MISRSFARIFTALPFVLGVVTTATAAQNLGPGSPAPRLEVKRWLKGVPVKALDPKATYVVEFWATWCGPCIESIPHISQLAKANQDVTFIGVGIWEEDEGSKLPDFVAKMGDKMDYTVAYSGNHDGMAVSWMQAASQNGIPTAFIVKNGVIMWVGHPMGLDKPLQEVKEGKFDLVAFKRTFDKRAAANRKRMAIDKEFDAIVRLFDGGKRAEAKRALAGFVLRHPDHADSAKRTEYSWLAEEDPTAWDAKTKSLLASGNLDDLYQVASFALTKAHERTGGSMARKAIALVLAANIKNDFDALLYAQSVYRQLGDTKEALTVTDKMIEVLPTTRYKDDAEVKENLANTKAELQEKLKSDR